MFAVHCLQTSALSGDGRHLTDLGQKAVKDGLLYVINNNLKSIRYVAPGHKLQEVALDIKKSQDSCLALWTLTKLRHLCHNLLCYTLC
jgi:hypothetical protein